MESIYREKIFGRIFKLKFSLTLSYLSGNRLSLSGRSQKTSENSPDIQS